MQHFAGLSFWDHHWQQTENCLSPLLERKRRLLSKTGNRLCWSPRATKAVWVDHACVCMCVSGHVWTLPQLPSVLEEPCTVGKKALPSIEWRLEWASLRWLLRKLRDDTGCTTQGVFQLQWCWLQGYLCTQKFCLFVVHWIMRLSKLALRGWLAFAQEASWHLTN